MDEIAPEYDVVVLGTGMERPRMEGYQIKETDVDRIDGMCALWVWHSQEGIAGCMS